MGHQDDAAIMTADSKAVQQNSPLIVSTYPHSFVLVVHLSLAAPAREIDRSENYGVPDVSSADRQFSSAKV